MSTKIQYGYERIEYSTNETTRYRFDSTEERDKVINKFWPERECMDAPGTYKLPNGDCLGVYLNEVTWYKNTRKANTLTLLED